MVKNHQFRSKFFFMGDITKKLLLLLKSRDTYIRLAALRVFRACVGTKDEFYVRILLKNEVLAHVMETLRDTESRYNLLNSACLEFLEFLRKVNTTESLVSETNINALLVGKCKANGSPSSVKLQVRVRDWSVRDHL